MSQPPLPLTQDELVRKLRTGQHAKRSFKMHVSGRLLILGLLSGAGSQSVVLTQSALHNGWDSNCLAWEIAWFMMCIGLCISCYAPLSDDVWLARAVIMLNAAIIGYQLRGELLWFHNRSLGEGAHRRDNVCPMDYTVQFVVYSLLNCMFICMSAVSLFCHGPTRVQSMMWATIRTYFSLQVLWELTRLVLGYCGVACESCSGTAFLFADIAALFLTSYTGLRDLTHSRLHAMLARTQAKAAAASVAGLLGDCDARQAFAQAATRFRCIDLTALTEAEMATRDPDPALYGRSEQIRLGECDAFVSHSWSDDASGKWAALQQWRRAFVTERGREPRVWIDKCCIDQANIEADLRCLPIFLNGCREMVVLCGSTYFVRLWCVMELFTLYHLGLSRESLTVRPVLREDQRDIDLAAIHAAVGSFDVGHCECRSDGDRHKLMEIIRAGGIQGFNTEMRVVLRRTGLLLDDHAGWSLNAVSSSTALGSTDDWRQDRGAVGV